MWKWFTWFRIKLVCLYKYWLLNIFILRFFCLYLVVYLEIERILCSCWIVIDESIYECMCFLLLFSFDKIFICFNIFFGLVYLVQNLIVHFILYTLQREFNCWILFIFIFSLILNCKLGYICVKNWHLCYEEALDICFLTFNWIPSFSFV